MKTDIFNVADKILSHDLLWIHFSYIDSETINDVRKQNIVRVD